LIIIVLIAFYQYQNPEGVLLNRAILIEMSDNEMIHIKPALLAKA
jgi:hypothetical protein